MKKALMAIVVVLIVLTAFAFIFIPKELKVSKVMIMHTNENLLSRYLSDNEKWERWWPEQKSTSNKKNSFTYKGFSYELSKIFYHEVEVKMQDKSNTYLSRIIVIPIAPDSIAVKWQTTVETSANPIKRFLNYEQARSVQENMKDILEHLKVFNEKAENLYAYNIHRTSIKDTILVTTKITTINYPSINQVYTLIANLKKYLSSKGAKETNYPMLNITTYDSIHYNTMVAIPSDKIFGDSGNISFKRMIIYKDKTIIAEVKGGPQAIKNAHAELDLYMKDYNLTSPVIPWELLITDRSKEKDTTKWVTQIYRPIV